MFCYVDDSKNAKSGFNCLAFVFMRKDPTEAIYEIYKKCNLGEGYEYKSRNPKQGNSSDSEIRNELFNLMIFNCKIALAFFPYRDSGFDETEVYEALNNIIEANNYINIDVRFDEGIVKKPFSHKRFSSIDVKSKSNEVRGIQLADLIANTASVMLKCETGELSKMVPCNDPSYPDTIELEFELWANIRYAILSKNKEYDENADQIVNATFETFPNGLWVSSNIQKKLDESIKARFGTNYLGCIH